MSVGRSIYEKCPACRRSFRYSIWKGGASPAPNRWRQQVGGSAIEASKIAGHSDLEMTGEYTCVSPDRQNELTRRIQQKLGEAAGKNGKLRIVGSPVLISGATDASSVLEDVGDRSIDNTAPHGRSEFRRVRQH